MPSKSMSHKTCIFSSNFCLFWLFSASCAFSSKCLKPSKNCGFVALRAYQHCVFVGTQSNEKIMKKPTKNSLKRCRTLLKSMLKTCCFLTSIFSGFGLDLERSWASNLEPSWPKMRLIVIRKPLPERF